MTTAAIVATDVTRTYQLDGFSVPALRGVSLTVEPGDYVAIVGTSGSGKSTLMHLLGGLDRPTSGTLLIGGRDVGRLAPNELAELRNSTIGFVFQSFHLLARTTAQDNVGLPLVYRGIGRRERRARATTMLDRVGLAHRITHRPNQLSGGEQQRVAIARALVTGPSLLLSSGWRSPGPWSPGRRCCSAAGGDRPGPGHRAVAAAQQRVAIARALVTGPSLLLADEPTGNLDSATGQSILTLLESLNAEGVAVVLVTHDRDVAARAGRQIVMSDGLIVS